MKVLLLICLAFFATACATKQELKDTQTRLERVETAEACHGETLELVLIATELRNPQIVTNPELAAQLQVQGIALAKKQAVDCAKFEQDRAGQK